MRPPRRPALRLLPVALLILAIAVHAIRIEVFDEDPQRSSAFAMFATVDIGATRRVIVTAPGDTPIVLEVADDHAELYRRLMDAPSDAAARSLAELLLQQRWDVNGGTASPGGRTALDRLRVQVVGLETRGRTLTRHVLVDVVVEDGDR